MKLSNAVIKFIEEWIQKYGEMENERPKSLEGIVREGTKNDTGFMTAVRSYARFKERERIFEGISGAFDCLEEDKRVFIYEYYWGSTKKTIEGATRAVFVDERTGKRWKKEFAEEIAQRLGWF